jgi:hypothetical protein
MYRNLALLVLAVLGAGPVSASEYGYAMIDVENKTNVTITYSFRWQDQDEHVFTLEPRARRWHALKLTYFGQENDVTAIVEFDEDPSSRKRMNCEFVRPRWAAARNFGVGRRYEFHRPVSWDIDLVQVN